MSLVDLAQHFDQRAADYPALYEPAEPANLFQHEKRVRASWTAERLGELAGKTTGTLRWLDLGCGDGRLLSRGLGDHANVTAIGVDLSQNMLAAARQRLDSEGLGGSRIQLLTPDRLVGDDTFDVITAMGVIGYQPNQYEFAAQWGGRLRPGGTMIMTLGNERALGRCFRQSIQRLRRTSTPVYRGVRQDRMAEVLAKHQIHLRQRRGLMYGLGLRRSRIEVSVSRYFERRQGWASRWLAQVYWTEWQRASAGRT